MKTLKPKTLFSVMLITLLAGLNGCMTQSTVKYAQGQPNEAWINNGFGSGYIGGGPQKPKPYYYFLLPLSIPADIATSPIQAIGYGLAYLFTPSGC